MTVLDARNVFVNYGPVEVLRGVSLRVGKGDLALLIGVNGAGKSTFLKAAFGMLPLAGGSIAFGDSRLEGLTTMQRIERGLALVPQGRRVFPTLTVQENLELVATDCEPALEFFPRLRTKLGEKAGFLSGGEQQMVSLARAILLRPKLLLLDEPSLGLAPVMVLRLFELIRRVRQEGYTILIVEQNVRQVLSLVDRAYLLEVGRIKVEGRAADLAEQDFVRKAYVGL